MRLTFCGAAGIVTGSCYLIESGNDRILVDCGMFQGAKEVTRLNYKPFIFNPRKISCMLLTHAHIDHSGLIPKLMRNGFRGRILGTTATVDLCRIMLEDSGHIQQSETDMENRRRLRGGLPPRKPLYTIKDAKDSFPLFRKIRYGKFYDITENIRVRYRDAGHIIGSAILELYVTEEGTTKKIVFSGDLGQGNVPIINDPAIIEDADYVLIESTYGNRLHEDIANRDGLLLKYIRETYRKGGKLLIPSFAVERVQELLYSFNKMIKEGKFPKEEVFLDSPLAIKVTDVFKKHEEFFDEDALNKYPDPFSFPNLVCTSSVRDSVKLNDYRKPCIILAGSGMCTAGRIRHHFKHGLWDPKNTVLFVGYQAEHTLGRVILEGARKVRMMGIEVAVRADIRKINSFSAHADYMELVKWMKGFSKKPEKVFIVHGEKQSSAAFRSRLRKEGFDCHIPYIGEKVVI